MRSPDNAHDEHALKALTHASVSDAALLWASPPSITYLYNSQISRTTTYFTTITFDTNPYSP